MDRPIAANSNTAATTIPHDDLGFLVDVEEEPKTDVPTSKNGFSLGAIHDALHKTGDSELMNCPGSSAMDSTRSLPERQQHFKAP